jgi:hypothetical protein
MPGLIVQKKVPFALFRFENGVVEMNETEFKDAIAQGRQCACGDCVDCEALRYAIENDHPFAPLKT